MAFDIDTKDIDAVAAEAGNIYRSMYSDADPAFIPWACSSFRSVFSGQYGDYKPIDVPYHDQEHTMQGFLCMVRLLHGRHRAGVEPAIPRRTFELGVLAILLHDTGYLRPSTDNAGTGAKYTLIHVERSCEFAEHFLTEQGYTATDVKAVQNMIQCTAMRPSLADIPFADQAEQQVGYALATSDLLGQMSAEDYVDRLPELYAEFQESYEYFGEKAERLHFESADTLVANTPNFWREYVLPKLENQCAGLYRYLADPYPEGENEYLKRIDANVDRAARMTEAKRERR